MAPCQGARPGAIPGNRTNFLHRPRASSRSRVSKTQFARGSTEAACQFFRGRGRQAMHLPCKQAYVGALPTGSTISLRETRPRNRGRPHKPVQVGVTPTPATTFVDGEWLMVDSMRNSAECIHQPIGKRSGCRPVNPVSSNKPEATTGALPALPTISGSVAQSEEQPVVYGKAEGASPFGSAIFLGA